MLSRVEQATQLLTETLARVHLDAQLLLPLARVALQALTVDALHVFQVRAIGEGGGAGMKGGGGYEGGGMKGGGMKGGA